MKASLAIGIVGADARTTDLARRLAPGGILPTDRFRLTLWSPGPGGDAGPEAAALAARVGAKFLPDWAAVVNDASLDAIVVGVAPAHRGAIVARALAAGKIVCACPPVAASLEDFDRIRSALGDKTQLLLAPGDLRLTMPGAHALEAVGRGELGHLHSIFGAVRLPQRVDPLSADPIRTLGSDLLDFVLAAVPASVRRVYASSANLFGSAASADTATVIARFDGETIATLEVSHCLPAALAAPPQGEVEIEIAGSAAALRLEPWRAAVRVYAGGAEDLRPWVPEPVAALLEELWNVADGKPARADYLAHQRRLLELLQAVGRSIASGEAVELPG